MTGHDQIVIGLTIIFLVTNFLGAAFAIRRLFSRRSASRPAGSSWDISSTISLLDAKPRFSFSRAVIDRVYYVKTITYSYVIYVVAAVIAALSTAIGGIGYFAHFFIQIISK